MNKSIKSEQNTFEPRFTRNWRVVCAALRRYKVPTLRKTKAAALTTSPFEKEIAQRAGQIGTKREERDGSDTLLRLSQRV